MINSLFGVLSSKNESSVQLDLNGIEFSVIMPFNSIVKLPGLGEKVRIFTFLQHSQDVMQLFGFSEVKERIVFLDLIKVSGIGPKQAIKILSGIEVETLVKMLDDNDVNALSRLPGIGKKTAQKLILALRGKLKLEPDVLEEATPDCGDIIKALVDMGFEKKAAESVVGSILKEEDVSKVDSSEREQLIFRRAIILLSS